MNKNEMFPKGFFSKKRPEVKKYIELIDKYAICQSDSDDYNPPSYIWTDNTGELIRCKDCKWFGDIGCAISIVDDTDKPSENDFCSWAERKEE